MNRLMSPSRKGETVSRSDTSSSIRGKISAPIPISADDDEEFPIRTPGAGIATPLGQEGAEKQLRLPDSEDSDEEETPGLEEIPEEPYRAPPPVPVQEEEPFDTPIRQTSSSRFRESDMTVTPSSAGQDLKRGKKNSLRSVLGRLFGRKRKVGVSNGKHKDSGRADLHRSDPLAIRNKTAIQSMQRSASMPINELANSHTTSEDDKKVEHEKSESLFTEGRTRPRRATTPSRLYSPTTTGSEWVGLTPRPASSHARSSVYLDDSQVGQAITSGSNPHRRSRSLNHLRHPSLTTQSTRRRSDEIKYWRESYNPDPLSPLSPMSSQPAPTEHIPTPHDEAATFPEEVTQEVHMEAELPKPEPFNFGLAGMKITQAASLDTRIADIENKIGRLEDLMATLVERSSPRSAIPAPPGSERAYSRNRPRTATGSDVSLPARNPDRMLHSSPRQHNMSVPIDHLRPATASTTGSVYSNREAAVTSGSPSLSPRAAYSFPVRPSTREERDQPGSRPLSTSTTIRGAPSSSPIHHPQHLTQPTTVTPSGTFTHPVPLSKHGSLTAHHYSALLNLITAESNARTILENQVLTLQRQLATVLAATVAPPVPAHHHHHQYSPTPTSPQDVTMNSVGEFSSFDHTESESELESEANRYQSQRSQQFQQGGYLSDDNDLEPEVFATPGTGGHRATGSEDAEQWLSEEEFQREVREQAEEVRRQNEAANATRQQRTMSLSQMTMGKGARAGGSHPASPGAVGVNF